MKFVLRYCFLEFFNYIFFLIKIPSALMSSVVPAHPSKRQYLAAFVVMADVFQNVSQMLFLLLFVIVNNDDFC